METPYEARLHPAPIVDASSEPFYLAAREGVLHVKRCLECRRLHWYPRALCPYCLGETEWLPVSGRGSVYSVSVTRRAGPRPYAMAFVRLEEGVTMLTNVVAQDLDTVHIGQAVEVSFEAAEGGWKIPMFRPVGEDAQ